MTDSQTHPGLSAAASAVAASARLLRRPIP